MNTPPKTSHPSISRLVLGQWVDFAVAAYDMGCRKDSPSFALMLVAGEEQLCWIQNSDVGAALSLAAELEQTAAQIRQQVASMAPGAAAGGKAN